MQYVQCAYNQKHEKIWLFWYWNSPYVKNVNGVKTEIFYIQCMPRKWFGEFASADSVTIYIQYISILMYSPSWSELSEPFSRQHSSSTYMTSICFKLWILNMYKIIHGRSYNNMYEKLYDFCANACMHNVLKMLIFLFKSLSFLFFQWYRSLYIWSSLYAKVLSCPQNDDLFAKSSHLPRNLSLFFIKKPLLVFSLKKMSLLGHNKKVAVFLLSFK